MGFGLRLGRRLFRLWRRSWGNIGRRRPGLLSWFFIGCRSWGGGVRRRRRGGRRRRGSQSIAGRGGIGFAAGVSPASAVVAGVAATGEFAEEESGGACAFGVAGCAGAGVGSALVSFVLLAALLADGETFVVALGSAACSPPDFCSIPAAPSSACSQIPPQMPPSIESGRIFPHRRVWAPHLLRANNRDCSNWIASLRSNCRACGERDRSIPETTGR